MAAVMWHLRNDVQYALSCAQHLMMHEDHNRAKQSPCFEMHDIKRDGCHFAQLSTIRAIDREVHLVVRFARQYAMSITKFNQRYNVLYVL